MRGIVIAVAFVAACNGKKPPPPDGGVTPTGPVDVTCAELPTPATGTCDFTAGSTTTLIEGTVLTPTTVYHGGQVTFDQTGTITCVGCDCAQGGETTLACGDASISPGLINTHDHITYAQNAPYNDTGERYDDRHQWRVGLDGHTKIPAAGGATNDQVRWGELRFLMGGARRRSARAASRACCATSTRRCKKASITRRSTSTRSRSATRRARASSATATTGRRRPPRRSRATRRTNRTRPKASTGTRTTSFCARARRRTTRRRRRCRTS